MRYKYMFMCVSPLTDHPLFLFLCLVGKTAVSIKLAQELGGEVINADVYQMYKGLNIATAKITLDEVSCCLLPINHY